MVHVDPTAMEAAEADLAARGIDVVRLGYSDMIGAERGRDLLVRRFARTVGDGVAFCRSVYGTSPMGDVVDIEGGISAGLPDVVAVPDMSTLQNVPWEPGVAHVIADVYNPDGSRSEESPPQCAAPGDRPLRGARHAAHGRTGAGVLRPRAQ
jgi:glutamine synthetase